MKWPTITLTILVLATSCNSAPKLDGDSSTRRAVLGVETSPLNAATAAEYDAKFNVRWQGRLVQDVQQGSAADVAGLQVGDLLTEIDGVALYSHDDIDDLLRMARPGQEVSVKFSRAGEGGVQERLVELQSAPGAPAAFPWKFASLAHLPEALEASRARKKKVLVGLSGSET